ncbi:hypothetical protein AB1Y20_000333 [Prymnesium parvum]|uniref:PS II complex 12 kDa extrinsic protein n=1 Tax=Prymnesium parvum TaxID=97485 RepID=A0AB34K923_PRYPA
MKLAVLLSLAAAVCAYVPTGAPTHVPTRTATSPSMSAEGPTTRRAMLASALLLAPAAANAMVIPGLNSPGLVPAKKPTSTGGRGIKNEAWASIRDSSNFWSPKGIMDSVPKMKGIITPKSAYDGFNK